MIPRTKQKSPQKLKEEINIYMTTKTINSQQQQSQQTIYKGPTFSNQTNNQVHNIQSINSKKMASPEKKAVTQFSPPPQIYNVYDCQGATS